MQTRIGNFLCNFRSTFFRISGLFRALSQAKARSSSLETFVAPLDAFSLYAHRPKATRSEELTGMFGSGDIEMGNDGCRQVCNTKYYKQQQAVQQLIFACSPSKLPDSHRISNNFSYRRTRNRIYCIVLCVCGNHKMYLHCQPAATDVGKVGK